MWAKCGQKSSPRSPLPQREIGPVRQQSSSVRAVCDAGRGRTMCGYAARSRRCLMALTPMSVPARMPSALSVVTMASTWGPAPCGADRVDEQGECGQDDEAEPFEDVVDAAGDEPVGHVMGDVDGFGPVARVDAGECFAGVGRGFAVGHVCSDQRKDDDGWCRRRE